MMLMQETESFESSFSDTKYSILSVKEIFRKDEIKFDIIFDFGQYEKNKHDLTGLLAFGGKYVALSHRGSVVLHDLSLIYKNRYEFLHSYHSDLVDRECAKAYLPKLSTDLNKLSSAFPLDNTQDALEAVSKGNAIRCHINFSAL